MQRAFDNACMPSHPGARMIFVPSGQMILISTPQIISRTFRLEHPYVQAHNIGPNFYFQGSRSVHFSLGSEEEEKVTRRGRTITQPRPTFTQTTLRTGPLPDLRWPMVRNADCDQRINRHATVRLAVLVSQI